MSSCKSKVSPSSADQFSDCLPLGRVVRAKRPKFYTIEEIADCLVVSTRTVRRWIDDELLVAHRMNGVVRISEAGFATFLAAQRDD
jgi:excisionase family DNA binding protein